MQFVQCSFLRYTNSAENSDKVYVVGLFRQQRPGEAQQFFVKCWWGKFSNPNPTCRSETFKSLNAAMAYFSSRASEKVHKGYQRLRLAGEEEFGSMQQFCEFWQKQAGFSTAIDLGLGSLEEKQVLSEGDQKPEQVRSTTSGHNDLWKFVR
jgi:predicted DNA-binding WGR domain protein